MFVLKPSSIQGIGVFTTKPIAAGEHLRLWQEEDWRFVSFAAVENDPELRELSDTYCVREADGFHCPLDFHRMSIGWYMNHSDTANARYRDATSFEYCAARDIEAGEEIVCDYRLLSPFESAP